MDETKGQIYCLGFDGKRDKFTKVFEEVPVNGNPINKYILKSEEHISFVEEPSGKYLDHITVDFGKGTGREIAQLISDLLREYNSQETFEAICADGTAVNTVYKTGAIAELERNLGRALYWSICLKYGNEFQL